MNNVILNGNALQIPLSDESVQCVVTSPPYWSLRNYNVAGQLGLEPTPEEYVVNMVRVFREVRRVLRPSGVAWINLGDSYAAKTKGSGGMNSKQPTNAGSFCDFTAQLGNLKPKNLVGIPWRVAFALQADGWWLRSDIIWHKPNVMPESVTDRPTKAHEYVFLLSKSARYFYDAEAVKEKTTCDRMRGPAIHPSSDTNGNDGLCRRPIEKTRNRRTVWTIPTHPYSGAHFATFPPKLVEPCILAGTSAKGECPVCGLAWVRVVERTGMVIRKSDRVKRRDADRARTACSGTMIVLPTSTTTGWHPQCDHDAEPIPQLVLDPFAGTATVGQVAIKHRRRFVGVELNGEYIEMARERTSGVQVALL